MQQFSTKALLDRLDDLLRNTVSRGTWPSIFLPLFMLRRILAAGGASDTIYTSIVLDQKPLHILAASLPLFVQADVVSISEHLQKLGLCSALETLHQAGLLPFVADQIGQAHLGPQTLSSAQFQDLVEEVYRRYNTAGIKESGEFFTPSDVTALLLDCVLLEQSIQTGKSVTLYDPCCGPGGLLLAGRERVYLGGCIAQLAGQELNPLTHALCALELFAQGDLVSAHNIVLGSTLAHDGHQAQTFDIVIANPPYGCDWHVDEKKVRAEYAQGIGGRFRFGLPRVSDGQLLFVQHIVAHMKPAAEGGSRAAVVINGSPLFTGGAGSGENQIRRWLLECDFIEAIIALPTDLFYNTGIGTYIIVLNTAKVIERDSHVLLIDARTMGQALRRSVGDKRCEIGQEARANIVSWLTNWTEHEHTRIHHCDVFGERLITVDRPKRVSVMRTVETEARAMNLKAVHRLPESSPEFGPLSQRLIHETIAGLIQATAYQPDQAKRIIQANATERGYQIPDRLLTALVEALSVQDDAGVILYDAQGSVIPDIERRDTEHIPLHQTITEYMEREVLPHVPDAYVNTEIRDPYDGAVGLVAYEISFPRYFYVYKPPRPLAEITADLWKIEMESRRLFDELFPTTKQA